MSSDKLRGTPMPYECLSLNFDTLMDDYIGVKQTLDKVKEYQKSMESWSGSYDYGTKAVSDDLKKILEKKK